MTNLSFFQINDIEFIVPPTSISVHKEGLNYSIKSLRTKSSVKIASGNGVYHVQVNITVPPEDFLALHRLICQIKNNPFVYIENSFLKDSLDAEEYYESKNKHLFFTTMGVNVNNHPASPGSFIVELDLRYFNTKPYIENLGYKKAFNDLEKVSNPKLSKVYVDYSNWLQTLYLNKYFDIEIPYSPGEKGLHLNVNKMLIVKEIYKNSKYTEIKNRRFVNLKMEPKLSKFFRDAFEGKTKEDRKAFLKEIAKTNSEEKPLEGEELKKAFFEKLKKEPLEFISENTRVIQRTDNPEVFAEKGKYNDIDVVHKGKIEHAGTIDGDVNFSLEITDANYPYLLLPREFKLVNDSEKHYFFEYKEGQDSLIFSWNKGETKQSFDPNVQSLSKKMFAGTIVRILEVGEKVFFYYKDYEYFPILRKKFEEFKKEEDLKYKAKKHYKELETFLSENYQPYLDRKDISNVIYESISSVAFLDYEENTLNILAGEKSGNRYEMEGVDLKLDLNTVITGINGSLRHITPSIPILGQETPTHQFLGSMEPNYQMSLIGKGSGGRMPDSFLNLEKARRDSQENAKKFNEIPDGANFAIDSLITKLFGSYEASFFSYENFQYGGGNIDLLREKFNFSVNSVSTFTVEGQPETYGMNIHFQETRSYKEEEIRPAYTNYSYGEKLSAEFFNAVLGSKIKIPEEKKVTTFSRRKPKKSIDIFKETKEPATEDYQWMNWKTKYVTSEQWYRKPFSYNQSSVTRLKKKGIDISIPTKTEMEKVKKYLVDGNYTGKLWSEVKNATKTAFIKTGEKERNSNQIVDPDKCAYYLCKTISTIFDYFEILFPETKGKLSIDFTSTLRINSDINYMTKRGNHKTGTAADLDLIGVNLTEAAIYIYLMQRLGYIKDYVGGRKGVFLGMGLYGGKAHEQKVKMQKDDNSWLHLDLNAVVNKYVIEDEGEQFVFHVPGIWRDGLRAWTGNDYYFANKSKVITPNYFFGHFLNVMKTYDKIDSNHLANRLLKPYGFETMKTYRERLEAAHEQLNQRALVKQEKAAEEGKTLVNFWNDKLKSIISEKENIDINSLELKLPENCGANITIVNSGKRQIINLNNRDSDFRDWYPASMIKFVAAIYSAYSMIENLDYFDSTKINFKFINKAKKEVSFSYQDLVSKAIKQSENLPYSLLVAAAQKTYINEKLNETNSSIWISYPFAFNKWTDSSRKTWAGEYTNKPNRWEGYGKIKASGRDSEAQDVEKQIDFIHGENKQPIKGRSVVGTVVDFSKLMVDFIEEVGRPDVNEFYLLEADQGWNREKDNVFAFVESCLLADKGHNQSLPEEELKADLQNKLKYKIKESLKISDTFKIYHKPGRESVWATDCLYFKNEDEKKDSFGVTLWGEASNSSQASNRDFMTSNNFYGETGVSLTTLIGYCMSYSAQLKLYISEDN